MRHTALIVDFGGVLTSSIFDSFKQFCIDHGVAPSRLKQVLLAELDEYGSPDPHHPIHLVEKGHISSEEFNHHLAEQLSEGLAVALDPGDIKLRLFAGTRPEPRMFEAILNVRNEGNATALLSNSWGGDGYPRETFEMLFDAVVLSGDVGMRKPDPEIYKMACNLISRDPAECVFIDDLKVNVEGAERVGMRGIHHTDLDETIALVNEIFGIAP